MRDFIFIQRAPKPAGLKVKPVQTDEELHLATELMLKTHAVTDPLAYRWLSTIANRYPNYRREHTRIAVLRNEVVAALRITTDTIRLGEARLKMGGLGWVATAERHRKNGIASVLIQDALAYMRDHRYHVSMLFGIPNFYPAFGYATALADYSIRLNTAEALGYENPYRLRVAKPGDIPVIQRLHNAADGDTACSILRTSAHFKNRWIRAAAWRVLTDAQGKVLAYFYPRVSDATLVIDELAASDPSLNGPILAAAAGLAEKEQAHQLSFSLPPTHAFAHFLLQFRSVHEMRLDSTGGGMLAFIDLVETLEMMTPEWESALQRRGATDLRTEVTLIVDRKNIRIRANRGAIDASLTPGKNKLSITQNELMQLLAGYRHLSDILATKRFLIDSDARRLLPIIFPKRAPFVWPLDRF